MTLQSFFNKLWHEIEPKNPLNKSFFISSNLLKYFRYFTFIVNTITFFWTLANTPNVYTPNHWALLAFLTNWGFLFCYGYSIFVVVWPDAPDHSRKWKIAYVLAEVGFALEMMICPFFFIVIFPEMLKTMNLGFWDIFYQILVHFVVPVLIWLEVLFSDIAFPKGHKVIVHVVIVAYLINNLLWTLAYNKPVYIPVDWVSAQSYVLKTMAAFTVIGGFSVGGLIHKWKKQRHEKITTNNKQE